MRFILNFIIFGIIFYLIWMFFPEAFQKLVTWTGDVVTFVKNFVLEMWQRYGHNPSSPTEPTKTALLLIPGVILVVRKLIQ
jgi:hypothetical protein